MSDEGKCGATAFQQRTTPSLLPDVSLSEDRLAMRRAHLLLRRTSRRCAPSRRLCQSTLGLPIIQPAQFKKFELSEDEPLTNICQALRSMERVRICEDPVLDAYCTTAGQRVLPGVKFYSDVLFIRSFYERLFQKIRQSDRVILTGNPGISKSV